MEALIENYQLELNASECMPEVAIWSVSASIQNDVSEVMPYLNAVLDRALYDSDNRYVIWKEGGRKYALRPHELAISSISDREEAGDLVEKAVAAINHIWSKRDGITPDYSKRTPPKLLDILKHLPRTNCRECGVPGCIAYAAELIEGNKSLEDCPLLGEEGSADALRYLEGLGLLGFMKNRTRPRFKTPHTKDNLNPFPIIGKLIQ